MLRYQYHLAHCSHWRHYQTWKLCLTMFDNTQRRKYPLVLVEMSHPCMIIRVCNPLLSKFRGKYIHINKSFALLGEDTYYQTLLTCLVITKVETGSRSWEQWLDRTRGDTSTSHQPPVTSSAADDPSVSHSVFTITEKAPTRAFSWLKAPTRTLTFKTLLRQYAKQTLAPR